MESNFVKKKKTNLTDSRWFYRLMALLFTLLLFFNANVQLRPSSTSGTGQSYDVELDNIPVQLKYDESEYYISGYQSSILVRLSSINKVLLDMESNEQTRKFAVVADLTDYKEGTYEVPLAVTGLNSAIEAVLEPTTIHVTIEQRVTKTYDLSVDTTDVTLDEGFEIDEVSLGQKTVSVETGQNIADEIDQVVVMVSTDKIISEDTTVDANIRVMNAQGEILSATCIPETVKAAIKVIAPTKEVSLKPVQTGTLASGIASFQMKLAPEKVVISGKQSILDTISVIELPIDVSGITAERTVGASPTLPSGVKSQTSSVKVELVPILQTSNHNTATSGGDNNAGTSAGVNTVPSQSTQEKAETTDETQETTHEKEKKE